MPYSGVSVPEKTSLDFCVAATREAILPHCRLQPGDIWRDEQNGHVVACGDATDTDLTHRLVESGANPKKPTLAVHDPPYNLVAFDLRPVDEYVAWCREWIDISFGLLDDNAALYVWLGADQKCSFYPFE